MRLDASQQIKTPNCRNMSSAMSEDSQVQVLMNRKQQSLKQIWQATEMIIRMKTENQGKKLHSHPKKPRIRSLDRSTMGLTTVLCTGKHV